MISPLHYPSTTRGTIPYWNLASILLIRMSAKERFILLRIWEESLGLPGDGVRLLQVSR